MPKHDFRTSSMIAYDTAMRRARGAIRRGLKQESAYWMKVADHAHRIDSRAMVIREAHARHLDAIMKGNLSGNPP